MRTTLIILLFSISAFAQTNQQASSFNEILSAQGTALELMDERDKSKGFKLQEMITDIGFSKTGILGVSALRAGASLELKWKRKKATLINDNTTPVMVIKEDATDKDLDVVSESIASIVESSGKVAKTPDLRKSIREALGSVQQNVDQINVTRLHGWKASGLRLDLNFAANGSLSFLTRAGFQFRIRVEWLLKDRPMNPQLALSNKESKFVAKVLNDLNLAADRVMIPGYQAYKITVGVGSSVRRNFFGLWKYSTGFLGAMIFVPVPKPPMALVSVPQELQDMNLEVGGFEEEETEKIWPWRRRATVVNFAQGMEQSIRSASFYAQRASSMNFPNWYVAELKTVNDISKTGIFGFANVSARGVIEIDHKRISQ